MTRNEKEGDYIPQTKQSDRSLKKCQLDQRATRCQGALVTGATERVEVQREHAEKWKQKPFPSTCDKPVDTTAPIRAAWKI